MRRRLARQRPDEEDEATAYDEIERGRAERSAPPRHRAPEDQRQRRSERSSAGWNSRLYCGTPKPNSAW